MIADAEPLASIVARAASAAGVVVTLPEGPVPRCAGGCDAVVDRRGGYCEACRAAQAHERRASLLREAYDSVSPRDTFAWCRHEDPRYQAATEGALKALAGVGGELGARGAAFVRRGAWPPDGWSVVLLGPSGIGKTSAATAFAHRLLDRARDAPLDRDRFARARGLRFVSMLDLARARAEEKLGREAPLVSTAARAPVLILDEVGYEDARHDPHALRDVVHARRRHGGRTIVTSGCTRAELVQVYGDALMRRLEDLGDVFNLHPRSGR